MGDIQYIRISDRYRPTGLSLSPLFPEALGWLEVVPLLLGRGGSMDPLGEFNCFSPGPHVDADKRGRLESSSALLLQGEPERLGSGLRCSPLLPSPQQASHLFALEIASSQVTVKVPSSSG